VRAGTKSRRRGVAALMRFSIALSAHGGKKAASMPRLHLSSIVLLAVVGASCTPAPPPPPSSPPPRATVAPPPASFVPPAATPTATASAAPEAARPEGPQGKLNVLLLTIDSLRADMPWAGYPRDIAPNLTAFEKKAVSYTRAYSVSSYTAMSFGGFLSGKYPGEIERSGSFFSAYPGAVTFFPELLQKADVHTLAAQAHFYFDTAKAGFHQGFDVYKMVPGITKDNKTDNNITSPEHTKLAMELLSEKGLGDRPFFAWFHFMDPHDIYFQHDGTKKWGKKQRDKYDSEVEYTDSHIGQILQFVEKQPWAKSTAIVITADHGEAFGEHGRTRHGFELWDVLIRVPLMIQAPGAAPRRIDTPRSTVDLAPTILELTGAPAEPSFQGKSLVPEIWGKAAEPRDVVIDLPRTSDNDRRRAMVSGDYKLLAYGDDFRFELYNVVKDPGENKDLAADEKEKFEEMKARYKERMKTVRDICPKNTEKLKGKTKGRKC
jgi:choline-sulfatase